MLVVDLPGALPVAQRLFVPAAAAALALWRMRERLPDLAWRGAMALTGMLALVALHIFYKQLFAIGDGATFIRFGLAERVIWEVALMIAAIALWQVARLRDAALALLGLGLFHSLAYTLLLHDPLWSAQAVGPWPVANLLLPAFAIPLAIPMLAAWIAPEGMARLRRPADLLRMAVILLFAFALWRQLFAGSLLVGADVGAVENIGRSVLAIALAIGFLLWGIRRGLRDWRIASLLLMLGAVGKVFLFDASGLEGLLRIASFLALGFSLIGIGWLYSRYLKADVS